MGFFEELESIVAPKPGAFAAKAGSTTVAKRSTKTGRTKAMLAIGVGAALLGYLVLRPGGRRGRRLAYNGPTVVENPRRRRRRSKRKAAKRRKGERIARNPRHRDPDVQKAIDFRKDFHWGYPARRVSKERVYPRPRAMT